MPDSACVVLVPSSRVFDPATEGALAELSRRRYPVWRIKGEAPPDIRDRMANDARRAGFAELLFVDPSIVFEPDDVERLRGRGMPIVCGVYAIPGTHSLSCEFYPGVKHVRFGRYGVPALVESADLGFALLRCSAFEALDRLKSVTSESNPYFSPPADYTGLTTPDTGIWFCDRVQRAGLQIVADTSIRLWKIGPYRHGWEDAGRVPVRHEDYTYFPAAKSTPIDIVMPDADLKPATPAPRPHPTRNALRPEVVPLRRDFPRMKAFVVSYPENRDSLGLTLASFRATDWGDEPVIIDQPADWKPGGDSAPANYKRAMEAAASDGCDFALILEDDTQFNRHLRSNILALTIVQRDQCDYLSLFVPDLLADPWERLEPSLGYRLAKPRYGGPDHLWEKHRVWGVQAILMSRRLVLAGLERWDRLPGVQDARLLGTCGELGVPLFYSHPSWVDHAPLRSGYNTPLAYAPDFDCEFKLVIEPGFQPPESIPGWLTRREGELLFQIAKDRRVLEIGAACGQATLCLAQQATHIRALDAVDEAGATEWLARYGCASRVSFDNLGNLDENASRFDLVVLSARDAAGIERDLAAARSVLPPGGLIVVLNYPDPAWPEVRASFDLHVRLEGWNRIKQVDFVGVFQT